MTYKGFIAAAALAAAIPTAASASVTLTGATGNPGWLTAKIVYGPGGIAGNPSTTQLSVYAGRTHFTGTDNDTLEAVTFDAYCIDIFNLMKANGTKVEVGSLTLDHLRKRALTTLLLSTADEIDSQSTLAAKKRVSAAIQLAAWEIMSEQAGNPYSLSAGQFSVTSGSVFDGTTSAFTLAQGYLAGLATATYAPGRRVLTLDPITPIANQRQAFIAAVPEPSAWAFMILGFGLVGGAMRSRRRTQVTFA